MKEKPVASKAKAIKQEPEWLKGGSEDVNWDFTGVRDFMQKTGITKENFMDVAKEAATQANWAWDFFIQQPWSVVENALVDAVKQQGEMRKKAGL